jgi:hypothetical protein
MTQESDKAKKELRRYLNPSIKGPKTDAVLEAISYPISNLVHNAQSVYDQLYVVTAEGRYLDQLMASKGLRRPESVGLSDDIFRQIGIEVGNRKQVRSLINNILGIVFGDEYVKANADSNFSDPYALQDGDTLIISFDDQEPVTIVFRADQFQNIGNATAQEVADAITKEIRRLGASGAATAIEVESGYIVRLISETAGPSSSVKVLGGRAQNELQFDSIVSVSGAVSTEWKVDKSDSGNIRITWMGGPNPSLGRLNIGDYVNIYGSAFIPENRGTFTITLVNPGIAGEAYFEIENPIGADQTQFLQGDEDALKFFTASRKTLNSKLSYAALYQTESRLIELFIPATTKVVRRENVGAAYLQEQVPSVDGINGPYIWDLSKGFVIGDEECFTAQVVDGNSESIISVDDASPIPDDQGYLVFNFGTSIEEGPVPYISRPSASNIIINPTYNFKLTHPVGSSISFITQNSAYTPEADGSDFNFYLTDEVSGRFYAEELVELVKATGIRIVVTVLYPNDEGFGKWGTDTSEIEYIFGADPE